jgi:hypothetical protein
MGYENSTNNTIMKHEHAMGNVLAVLFACLQGLRKTKVSKNMMGMQNWRRDLNLSGMIECR